MEAAEGGDGHGLHARPGLPGVGGEEPREVAGRVERGAQAEGAFQKGRELGGAVGARGGAGRCAERPEVGLAPRRA